MDAKVSIKSESTKFQMSYNVKKLRKPLRPFAGFHIILYFCTYMKKMIISGKDYLFREMETSNEGTTMTMRMTHFRVGVPDDIFSFDPNQYPDAVIMERVESPTDP